MAAPSDNTLPMRRAFGWRVVRASDHSILGAGGIVDTLKDAGGAVDADRLLDVAQRTLAGDYDATLSSKSRQSVELRILGLIVKSSLMKAARMEAKQFHAALLTLQERGDVEVLTIKNPEVLKMLEAANMQLARGPRPELIKLLN